MFSHVGDYGTHVWGLQVRKKHTFHMGDARVKEDKHDPVFLAFPDPLTWRPGAICDGAPAKNRAQWLMENKGMAEGEAQAFVMGEFPESFGPSAPPSGHFVDGKFPHTLELVKDAAGKSRVKFSVTPSNIFQPRGCEHDCRTLQC